ncbi:methyl-accepting chemotaxis protein [Natronocalculus amylovorans]|uniref:Methyl-accepting chemotaxis protein n=1 Tax=Natronocalculus amylovorans TaxID=2917812 RepID=A0AAE3FTT4_9EURY|nr:methyl-accepting chemotaxis protein [Natronocalculus amylovorans]MCL9815512.1 methyl-accepting chemotaxis protein [Natronocalculus amylovorans]
MLGSVSRLLRRLYSKPIKTDGGVVSANSTSGPETPPTGTKNEIEEPLQAGSAVRQDSASVNFDGVGVPIFTLNPDGSIESWNDELAELTGVTSAEAIGHEHASEMFYPDGRRSETLADKVLTAPKTAAEEYELDVENETQYRYADTSTIPDRHGVEKHIRFTATPIFEDDKLVRVIEVVNDRTEEVEQRRATEALVDELGTVLEAVDDGDLSVRATRTDAFDAVDSGLLDVVDDLNSSLDNIEKLTSDVEVQTDEIEEGVEETTRAATSIAQAVDEQHELLSEGVSEMQTFSATMEEVASTAEEVDTAADQASLAAQEGVDASVDARQTMKEVVDIGDDLVDTVGTLGEQMDDIRKVVEIISDVAEQTNLLALNANIEAARAGSEGDGFAVVANEVKNLSDETQKHTERITNDIDDLAARMEEAYQATDESQQHIGTANEQIGEVLDSFDDIAAASEQVADGISQVSRATTDQAATVEELTVTLESVQDQSEETEAAATQIVAATDQQAAAVEQLSARVRALRGGQSLQ